MKHISLLILAVLLIGALPGAYQPANAETDDNKVPAPEFESITPDKENTFQYEINETITINYKTSRFDVDGMVLLGFGSNLTENILDQKVQNFTLVSSFGPDSFYEIKINVTSYTYFYAATWFNSLNNMTKEELDFKDGALGHQLWIIDGPQFPVFQAIEGTVGQGNNQFYAPLGKVIKFVYNVQDPQNDTYVTLSFANTTEKIYNATTSTRVNMTQITFSVDNSSRFEFNYTMSQRIVFVAAFNANGWERTDGTSPRSYTINSGFNFNTTFSENLGLYTDVDHIIFNMTSFNETTQDEFFYRFRVFENSSAEDPFVDWSEVSINNSALIETTLVNDTRNYNTTKKTYNIDLGMFEVDEKIELQIYVDYLEESYNETTPKIIIIQDSRPNFNLISKNETATRNAESVVLFDFSTIRGEILDAQVSSNYTSSTSIKSKENETISFVNNGETVEGVHVAIFNITAQYSVVNASTTINQARILFNVSRTFTVIFHVDLTAPVIQLLNTSTIQATQDGFVSFRFSALDVSQNDTGIAYVTVSWGNNIVINATSFADLGDVSWKYTRSGTYTITIIAVDKVGNEQAMIFTVVVTLPDSGNANNKDTPISFPTIIVALFTSVILLSFRRKQTKLNQNL